MRIVFNPTPDQIGAIQSSDNPSGANPFQTASAVAAIIAAHTHLLAAGATDVTATKNEINRVADQSVNKAVAYLLVSAELTVINGTVAAFTLPATAMVRKVWIKVTTTVAGQTVDVGRAGSLNGFLAAASVAALGFVDGPLGGLGLDDFSSGGLDVTVRGTAASTGAKVIVYADIVDMA